jgi:glyoxylase-like metal-dependent hydrolase (beta-lactamase superfamily II)
VRTDIYSFKVGDFACAAVSDGSLTYTPPTFPLPAALLFANAPKEELGSVLREHNLQPEQWLAWTSPYICLIVNTGKYRVLVDTGADGLAPSTGKLIRNLQAAGIAPEHIDIVILTHAHPDHIGGNTDDEGKPVFLNARYVMWKDEWEFWTSVQVAGRLDEHSREVLVSCARRNLLPIRGRLELIDRETEIVAGVRALPAPGHTPGHMALAIGSQGEQLLCVSDTVLHPIHLEQPGWYAAVDFAPEQAVATRRGLLKSAVDSRALVLAFHFPFPGLGHVGRKGDAWQWQPIDAAGYTSRQHISPGK